ncbi:hypothetical protein NDU88_001051 [Pleurodeles waltl]|uniref:Uncharacterized protein n=1 Tax=Pleurodeles waltl TaxID=8319 RepID=A0AAV7KP95_PLEWA|nr:hypothetical protein NDU88_001051 [Pleurodeles waltl]
MGGNCAFLPQSSNLETHLFVQTKYSDKLEICLPPKYEQLWKEVVGAYELKWQIAMTRIHDEILQCLGELKNLLSMR